MSAFPLQSAETALGQVCSAPPLPESPRHQARRLAFELHTIAMSTAHKISGMKCWAIPMLIHAILSGNLAIFIVGIIGSSMVLCCSSSIHQAAKNASCFKGCAVACAVLGGLHSIGMIALGAVYVGRINECTDTMTDNSCHHLDNARRLSSTPGPLHAAALDKFVMHAPLLLGALTGGTSLLVPITSLGATLAKPSDGTPALAPTTRGATGARQLAKCANSLVNGGSVCVKGCGRSWGAPQLGGSWVAMLASAGATDCSGCGKMMTSYDDCEQVAKNSPRGPGEPIPSAAPPLTDKENWSGPQGCYIQDRVKFRQFDPHGRGSPDADLSCSGGRVPERGHTPVCLCELNDDATACLHNEKGCDDESPSDDDAWTKDNDYGRTKCRDNEQDCCWGSWDEPFACDSGYRPELGGQNCWWRGKSMTCKKDSGYTTQGDCQEHIKKICYDQFEGVVEFFFCWMAWAIIGTIIYAVAACKAAKVPSSIEGPAVGTQMQTIQPGTAQSVVMATVIAQPIAAVPMGVLQAQAAPPCG